MKSLTTPPKTKRQQMTFIRFLDFLLDSNYNTYLQAIDNKFLDRPVIIAYAMATRVLRSVVITLFLSGTEAGVIHQGLSQPFVYVGSSVL